MAAELADPLAPARPAAGAGAAPPHVTFSRPRLGRAELRAMPAMRRFLLVLAALYLVKQVLFVVAFPPFSGHDEVAHYGYLQTVASEGRIPKIPDLSEWRAAVRGGGDPDIDRLPVGLYPYCRYALYWHCEPSNPRWANSPPYIVTYLGQYFPTGYQYLANHPPLYYLILTPVYWSISKLSLPTQQSLLRLASIPFGLLTVLLAFLLARTLFPADPFLGVTVPTFVAFQPQISYESAMLNNDILAIALYSAVLYLVVRGIRDRFPFRLCLALGVALGLAVLSKSTSLTAGPLIAVAVILALGWRDVRAWLARGIAILLPAGLLVAPWYVFLYRTYGNFDALAQISAVQSYWNRPEGGFWELLTSVDFVVMRFRETWGEFGWRVMPLDQSLLWAIAIPLIAAGAGLIRYLFLARRHADSETSAGADPVIHPARWQWIALGVLALACVVAYLAVVQFGTQFSLTQARYFFPVINAAALLLMLGLRTLIPRRFHHYGQGAVFAAMVLLNILIFTQYVIPHYLSA